MSTALKGQGNQPSFQDWNDLYRVLLYLDWIVEDEAEVIRASKSGGGLLAPWLDDALKSEPPKPRSRLAAWHHSYDALSELLRIIPGLDAVGESREERITALKRKLADLRAYRWLAAHSEFVRATETICRVNTPNGTEPERTWLEFRFLRAIQQPLSEYLLLQGEKYKPAFPTSGKLDRAAATAKQLRNFLKQNGGLFLGEKGLSWEVHQAAETLATKLSELSKKFEKPRTDSPILELQFMDAVAVALKAEFGTCSATALERLCDLIEYRPGGIARKAQRVASAVNNPGSSVADIVA